MDGLPVVEGLNAGMLVLLGLVVAAVIEPLKTFPVLSERRLVPPLAIGFGVAIAFGVLATPELARLDVFAAGALIGLSAIGGREGLKGITKK